MEHKCRFVKWMCASDERGPYYKLTCLECGKSQSECWYPNSFEIIDLEAPFSVASQIYP